MENETIIEPVAPDFGPLDVIGTLWAAPENEGDTPTALPGWHVNAPWPIAAFAAQRVTPTTPRRVFAGGTTVFYTFANEAEFLTLLEGADLRQPGPVPQAVTMRQARLALLAAGKLGAIAAAISALPSPQKEAAAIEWEYSQEVQRHNGFVSLLAPVLGMDAAALDDLFRQAGGL